METPASPLEHVRATIDATAAARSITLGPADTAWTVRGVPLAPFPARLRIDADAGLVWHDVVAAEVVPPVAVESVVDGIPLPRPEVRLMVGEARWLVAISYPLPFSHVSVSEVSGLLAAGPLYAAALTTALSGHVGKRWRAQLDAHGFVAGSMSVRDPRSLLERGVVVPWPDLGA